MATRKKREESKRTYILDMHDGTRKRVTVPDSWKLTFGPLVPGSKDHSVNSRQALVLRFYEGNKDNQRACFTEVAGFRDTKEMGVLVEKVETRRQTVQAQTPQGARDFDVEAIIKNWEDPDRTTKPGEEFLQLPQGINKTIPYPEAPYEAQEEKPQQVIGGTARTQYRR